MSSALPIIPASCPATNSVPPESDSVSTFAQLYGFFTGVLRDIAESGNRHGFTHEAIASVQQHFLGEIHRAIARRFGSHKRTTETQTFPVNTLPVSFENFSYSRSYSRLHAPTPISPAGTSVFRANVTIQFAIKAWQNASPRHRICLSGQNPNHLYHRPSAAWSKHFKCLFKRQNFKSINSPTGESAYHL